MDIKIAEIKKRLRRTIVERITAMGPADRAREEEALRGRFAGLLGSESGRVVLLYAKAFPEEIDTESMCRRVLDQGSSLVLPRVFRKEGRLRLFEIRDLAADLERGTLGIPEPKRSLEEVPPERIDWALVPGLGFDRRGGRLGRGAGHYDRLLPLLRSETPRWGLLLTPQWVDDLPVEPHDQRLDGVADAHECIPIDRCRSDSTI